jgi:hypothetical protein
MYGEAVTCSVCGAPMTPQADGRTYLCHYCGARIQAAIDGQQIAAGMKLDLANAETFLNELGAMLTQGFASKTRVDTQGGRVMGIEVLLDPDHFLATREGGGVVAKHKRVVRGIALKTATIPLGQWMEHLTASLARHANDSASATTVLAQLKGRGRY